jgi:hypothetical protein
MEVSEIDSTSSFSFNPVCRRCHGSGELDWIDYLKGQADQKGFILDSSQLGIDTILSAKEHSPAVKKILDEASKKLAENIDKQIIEQLVNSTDVLDSIFGGR